MELIRGLHNIRPRHRGCVATIGAFDGVHLGHQAVLNKLKQISNELQLPSLVITLEPLPREYFAPIDSPPRLLSFREKYCAIADQGIDRLLRVKFDEALSLVSAEDFIEKIFHDQLGIKYMIVGDDLRFGHERRGDFSLLQRMGNEFGFDVSATETFEIGEGRVSSTRIRQALENSDFEQAEGLLGRPYTISGKVVYGRQLGRTLGVPTANLQLNRIKAAMAGVYAVEVQLEGEPGKYYPAVANVGTRPTVDHGLTAVLEVHLLEFSQDIYRKHMDVIFRKKLRDETKFASLDELKTAIHNDIAIASAYFSQADK
ncbi:Riboflavin biosynthesis protein RibF [BD1-7 clade bacterium]|uniref:Riboflavin biosynthesis protein n=1 Tax=BD1-7 clade bacterium TaxID=2029982 RepID=A0A5S9PWW4_9GAMM|nr:Riboflavin biosynthesis protein RibF [BD1-7 clade bacterium]CAA0108820.1 Riboflavin biosynthesis protein RibF [BD1-7 clade bacterium]